MARKNTIKDKRPKECMFLGNSKELKGYLLAKKKYFKQVLKEKKNDLSIDNVGKINGYIDAIEEMLDQKYFRGKRVYSMPDMIEEIKLERSDLLEEMKAMKPEIDRAKCLADEAFEAENGYYANKFEEIYMSSGQVQLRQLADEYQALVFQCEGLEKCRKTLWWLLGVIHRPRGFFEKVIEQHDESSMS